MVLPALSPYKALALVATHLSVLAAGTWLGWTIRDADYQAHLKKDKAEALAQEREVRKIEGQLEAESQKVRDNVTQREGTVRIVYRDVVKEIPRYVTQTVFEERVRADGGLPAGFVFLYNKAASNDPEATLPSGIDPDTPTGLDLSALTSVATGNLGVCHSYRIEAEAWREWYAVVEKGWPKP